MTSKIVLTGGGTAGHVTPNLALIDALQAKGWDIHYMGSYDGVERDLISAVHIPYHPVTSGKLRRYFSWKNVIDPIKIIAGIFQSAIILAKIKPNIVFSKGGFVAFPVVVGAWLNRIPVIAHESDMSPGLANRWSFPFARKICVTFSSAKKHFKNQTKVEVTGTPIRQQLFHGSQERALSRCGFQADKPCVLIMGGSQGASILNTCVRQALDTLLQRFQVIHLCGKGKCDANFAARPGYYQAEYAQEELADYFAASQFVISRSGANSLSEILALQKPHILIPLSAKVSRGDQVQNARYFRELGISVVIDEGQLTPESLLEAIQQLEINQISIVAKIKSLGVESATGKVMQLIKDLAC